MPRPGRPRTRIDMSVGEAPESYQFATVQDALLQNIPLLAKAIQQSPADETGESAPSDSKRLDSLPPTATRNKRSKSR